MDNITFTMIKPDAVANGHMTEILNIISKSGYKITAMKLTQLTKEKAGEFYSIHKSKPFFDELIEYMTSGPIVAACLEKADAVQDFRKLIGATNPKEAAAGTIRKIFATSIEKNAIHGSDSNENAIIERNFHFDRSEIISF